MTYRETLHLGQVAPPSPWLPLDGSLKFFWHLQWRNSQPLLPGRLYIDGQSLQNVIWILIIIHHFKTKLRKLFNVAMADKTKGMLDTIPRSKDHTFVELNSKLQSGASGKNLNQISKNCGTSVPNKKKTSLNDYPTAKHHIGVSLNGGFPPISHPKC